MKINEALKKPWLIAGLIGAALAFLVVSVYYSEDRWSALTAIGTVGATLAAVIIPIQQNKVRLLDEEYRRLTDEWVHSETAHRVSAGLCRALSEYIENAVFPHDRVFKHSISQLEFTGQSYLLPMGRITITEALNLAMELEKEFSGSVEQPIFGAIPSRLRIDPLSECSRNSHEVSLWLERAESLVIKAELWQSILLDRYEKFGRRPEFAIRNIGKAKIGVNAESA